MVFKRLFYLLSVVWILGSTAIPAFATCTTDVCIGGTNSDGTVTICIRTGDIWRCRNVQKES